MQSQITRKNNYSERGTSSQLHSKSNSQKNRKNKEAEKSTVLQIYLAFIPLIHWDQDLCDSRYKLNRRRLVWTQRSQCSTNQWMRPVTMSWKSTKNQKKLLLGRLKKKKVETSKTRVQILRREQENHFHCWSELELGSAALTGNKSRVPAVPLPI